MSPCSSPAAGRPPSPNRIFSLRRGRTDQCGLRSVGMGEQKGCREANRGAEWLQHAAGGSKKGEVWEADRQRRAGWRGLGQGRPGTSHVSARAPVSRVSRVPGHSAYSRRCTGRHAQGGRRQRTPVGALLGASKHDGPPASKAAAAQRQQLGLLLSSLWQASRGGRQRRQGKP